MTSNHYFYILLVNRTNPVHYQGQYQETKVLWGPLEPRDHTASI